MFSRIFSIRRWRRRELLGAWIAYWVVLALVGLGPAAIAIWRATHGPANGTSSVNVRLGSLFELTVTEQGKTTWSGAIGVTALAFLVAGPPLVAWIAWLVTRRRAEGVREVV